MKPFNLERALAGDPVVTRDGRKVTQIFYFSKTDEVYNLFVGFDKKITGYKPDGKYYLDGTESPKDLFMAPVEKTVWFNYYRPFRDHISTSGPYDTEEGAIKGILLCYNYISTQPLTYTI